MGNLKTAALCVIISMFPGPDAWSATAGFAVPPYVHSVSGSTAVIQYEFTEPRDHGFGYRQQEAAAFTPAADKQGRVVLAALAPGTKYWYNILHNKAPLLKPESEHFFFTLPGPGRTVFTFAAVGDTRSGVESFDADHQAVVRSMIQHTVPDFLIHTGDMAGGAGPDRWQRFFAIEHALLKSCPLFAVRGNSEKDTAEFRRLFRKPGDALWTRFSYGNVHFVGLDILQSPSDRDYRRVAGPGSAQVAWLEKTLTEIVGDSPDFVVVFFHAPLFPVQSRGSEFLVKTLCPIFEKFGVNLVVNGNEHYFSHAQDRGVTYLISGGGGAMLAPVSLKSDGERIYHPLFHHLRIKVNYPAMDIAAVDNQGNVFFTHSIISRKVQGNDDRREGAGEPGARGPLPLQLFSSPGCPECRELRENVLPLVEQEMGPGSITLTFVNIDEPASYESYTLLESQLGHQKHTFPVLKAGGRLLSGAQLHPDTILAVLAETMARSQKDPEGPPAAAIIAGAAVFILILVFFKRRNAVKD
jgi:hypothetical protein